MAVEKKSVSLSGETLAQLDWIKQNVLHCEVSIPLSQLIAMAIGLAYYRYMIDANNCKLLSGTSPQGGAHDQQNSLII